MLEPTVPLLHIFHHRYQGLIVETQGVFWLRGMWYARPTGIMIMVMTASAVAITAAIATIAKEALLHCGRVVVGTVEGTDDGIRWNWNTRGHKSRR